MEENNKIKIANIVMIPSINVKCQLNLNIDSNTRIKQVINIDTCLIDEHIESLGGKALIKGALGVKVVYIDQDNIYNTLSDSVNFSETINNELFTPDCLLNIVNHQFICEFQQDDNYLKISIDGNIDCCCNLNNSVTLLNQTNSNLNTKKSILNTCTCVQNINKTTNFDFDFKLDTRINKMLSCDSKIVLDETKCHDGYVVVSGQIINNIIYEYDKDGVPCIKISNNSTPFKCEVEAQNSDIQCSADLTCYINLNSTQISTDIADNYTNFNFEYYIVVKGNIFKDINIDLIEDLYCLDSEVEVIKNNYDICKKESFFKFSENVDAEISLADELNVDEILGMYNVSTNITRHVIKDDSIIVEGVISGNLLYLDETHQTKQLTTQLPYTIALKQQLQGELSGLSLNLTPIACKCKIKRGNILVLDCEISGSGNAYTKKTIELIENVKYGKPLNYGDICFQIYLAHPNETSWDLCKRLHISQEKLIEYNKENPATYNGGEKVIVYR